MVSSGTGSGRQTLALVVVPVALLSVPPVPRDATQLEDVLKGMIRDGGADRDFALDCILTPDERAQADLMVEKVHHARSQVHDSAGKFRPSGPRDAASGRQWRWKVRTPAQKAVGGNFFK